MAQVRRYEMSSSSPQAKTFQFLTKINEKRLMLKTTRQNENLLIFSVVNNQRSGVMLEVFLNCVGCEFLRYETSCQVISLAERKGNIETENNFLSPLLPFDEGNR